MKKKKIFGHSMIGTMIKHKKMINAFKTPASENCSGLALWAGCCKNIWSNANYKTDKLKKVILRVSRAASNISPARGVNLGSTTIACNGEGDTR